MAACKNEEELIENIPKYHEIEDDIMIYPSWELLALRLLKNLWNKEGSFIFHEPVDPKKFNGQINDYFDKIT